VKAKILALILLGVVAFSGNVSGQSLEDMIEDELNEGSTTQTPADEEDPLDEDLDFEEPPPSSTAQAPAKKPQQKPNEAKGNEEAPLEDDLSLEESLAEELGAPDTPPEAPTAETPKAEAPKAQVPAPRVSPYKIETDRGQFDTQINAEFESRLFQIFSGPSPLKREAWDMMIAPHRSGVYRVQKGDTLWEISMTFFGDGGFWPKLWSENSALTNPHEIRPGRAIAFVEGTEEEAPVVTVTDVPLAKAPELKSQSGAFESTSPENLPPVYPDDPEAQLSADDIAAGTVLEEQEIVGGKPEIPEPLVPARPPLERLPPSFVEQVAPRILNKYDSTGLDIGRRKAVDVPATVYLPFYLSDGKPASSGLIDEIIGQERTAGFMQDVIVRMSDTAEIGQKFTAIMPRGNVLDLKSKQYGPMVEVGGQVEITQVVNAVTRVYRARVIQSVQAIEKGALLTDVPPPMANYTKRGPRADVEATVIGGEFDLRRQLFSTGAVVFLDRGALAGLAEGQVVAIRSVRGARRLNTAHPDLTTPVAIAKIARVFDRVSTALIIDSSGDVRRGDITGGPLPIVMRRLGATRQVVEKNLTADSEDSEPTSPDASSEQ